MYWPFPNTLKLHTSGDKLITRCKKEKKEQCILWKETEDFVTEDSGFKVSSKIFENTKKVQPDSVKNKWNLDLFGEDIE